MNRKIFINNILTAVIVIGVYALAGYSFMNKEPEDTLFQTIKLVLVAMVPYLVFVFRGLILSKNLKKDYPENKVFGTNFLSYVLCLFWITNIIAVPILFNCSLKINKIA